MWNRFVERLRCPISRQRLRLVVFEGQRPAIAAEHRTAAERAGIPVGDNFGEQTISGVLLNEADHLMYPVARGLPILLPYRTAFHDQFGARFSGPLAKLKGYQFASREPVPGERDVLRSFSKEWTAYRYDGVIWDVSYEDNERRLRVEIGVNGPAGVPQTYLEVGCGLGLTTAQAQRVLGGEAVGADLSVAVLHATEHFQNNPLLHLVEASAFSLPFEPAAFDVVYSRGVLHHTYSPERAFMSAAQFAKPGGKFYLWVYGKASIRGSALRLAAYSAEALLRPVLSRLPVAVSTAVLSPIALSYLAFNTYRRAKDPQVQPYDFRRALHAARDRFTPRYAYRQDEDEVMRWFRAAGYDRLEVVDWQEIPSADQDDYRRNTGVRGIRR